MDEERKLPDNIKREVDLMAQRRMIHKDILHSDEFLNISDEAKVLYFYLLVEADDEGFIGKYLHILRETGKTKEHIDELVKNDLIIKFNSKVLVISDWNLANQVQPSRRVKTLYQQEISSLGLTQTGKYVVLPNDYSEHSDKYPTICRSVVDNNPTQYSIVEDSIGENSIDKNNSEKNNLTKESVILGKESMRGKPKTTSKQETMSDSDFLSNFQRQQY